MFLVEDRIAGFEDVPDGAVFEGQRLPVVIEEGQVVSRVRDGIFGRRPEYVSHPFVRAFHLTVGAENGKPDGCCLEDLFDEFLLLC